MKEPASRAGGEATYFLLEGAVEDENEQALEGVAHGEEIGHDHSVLVDEQQPERPGEAEETQESERAEHPGPEKVKGVLFTGSARARRTSHLNMNGSVVAVDFLYVHIQIQQRFGFNLSLIQGRMTAFGTAASRENSNSRYDLFLLQNKQGIKTTWKYRCKNIPQDFIAFYVHFGIRN